MALKYPLCNYSGQIMELQSGDSLPSGGGGYNPAVITKSGGYTISPTDDVILCDASSGAFTITLAAAALRPLYLKKIDASANVVTVSGQTIDDQSSYTLDLQYEFVEIVWDGSQYRVTAE
jgi:hypothetical protein